MNTYSVDEVADMLSKYSLGVYADRFRAAKVDGTKLCAMDAKDLAKVRAQTRPSGHSSAFPPNARVLSSTCSRLHSSA